jgi:hypothetical protein
MTDRSKPKNTKQSNSTEVALLDRPVCDEIKGIYIGSMTTTYAACNEAYNKGVIAGIAKFKKEHISGTNDFFVEWEIEAQQAIDSNLTKQNALLSSAPTTVDLTNLDSYNLEDICDRYDFLTEQFDRGTLETNEELELLREYLEKKGVFNNV